MRVAVLTSPTRTGLPWNSIGLAPSLPTRFSIVTSGSPSPLRSAKRSGWRPGESIATLPALSVSTIAERRTMPSSSGRDRVAERPERSSRDSRIFSRESMERRPGLGEKAPVHLEKAMPVPPRPAGSAPRTGPENTEEENQRAHREHRQAAHREQPRQRQVPACQRQLVLRVGEDA